MLYVFRTFGFRAVIIAVALSLLGACSALRIGYGTAPDLVYWWLDNYIDFNDTQTPRVRESIKQWFAWHRRSEVPEYAAQLQRAQTEVLADTTPARVCEWQAELTKRGETAIDRIAPAAADLMLTITPDQLKSIDRKYAKTNAEFRDEYLQGDPRKRAEANLKRTLERAEMLYGRLDDSQRARISETLARSPFDPEVWFAERRQRQLEVLQTLRKLTTENANREQALIALRSYVDHLQRSPREGYRRYAERLVEFNCRFAANLHNATTAAQRRNAVDKLAGWEGDLRAIAATPVAEAN
jgi:Family of unknown function (DUF6279)